MKEPSGRYYIGIAEPGADGVTPRLELIFEGRKIVEARYNEILADTPEAVRDEVLRKYFRQSKRDSVYYRADTKGLFNAFVDRLTAVILNKQSLDVSVDSGSPEAENYARLAGKLQPFVDEYLAKGYEHNIGKITEKPEHWGPQGRSRGCPFERPGSLGRSRIRELRSRSGEVFGGHNRPE